MISIRILSNICRETNCNITPILSVLNRNRFYSMSSTNFMKSISISKEKDNLNKHFSVLTMQNMPNSKLNITQPPADTIIRYKTNLPDQLPSKSQVQKVFFKVLGFTIDVLKVVITWTLKTIEIILEHPKTKQYWSRLQQKIQEARKD